ncbi:hypothetical protein A0J61_05099 [Choanephora cucurbitarum]|uniref:Uncharacterized protein n=1 Tax=Choanephora cucurbitarum TaxID=101091 RepID=A0A1C7NHM3_9FUNG|nr:hypothetical protein A0J61_05099 [Choanephora cucurbitarum]
MKDSISRHDIDLTTQHAQPIPLPYTQPGHSSMVHTNLAMIQGHQMMGKSAFRLISTPNAVVSRSNSSLAYPIIDYACQYQHLLLGVSVPWPINTMIPNKKLMIFLADLIHSSKRITQTRLDRHMDRIR